MLGREKKIMSFCLNFLNKSAVLGIIKTLEIENKEISDPNEINNEIYRFT